MTEYAFDIKLWGVARVEASSEEEARKKVLFELNCAAVNFEEGGVKLTEVTIEDDDDYSELFEIDGEDVTLVGLD